MILLTNFMNNIPFKNFNDSRVYDLVTGEIYFS